MKMKRYLSLLLAGTLALALTACGGSAKTDPGTSDQPSTSDENWTPKENVTMIVSYKAGSGTDNTARVLAAYAEKYIGKPVIIENLEGGSGSIGWTALSQAAPDGYTLGFINLPNFNATISEGVPQKLEHNDIKWITPSDIPNYEFCPADEEILKAIKKKEVEQ